MFFPTLFIPLFALALASSSMAQDVVYDAEHNRTTLVGTWSSGSQAVKTGADFANPANQSFNYPRTTGVSYSFSGDGFYEIARYRFVGNGSEPTCITGVIGWVHGRYTLEGNGSITMIPLGDGFQQIQDPCAAVSNFIEPYNRTELYRSWRIFQDPQTLDFKLHLFGFDGQPVAPQFLVSVVPNMLPTQLLRNVSSAGTTTTDGFTTQNLVAKSVGAAPGQRANLAMGVLLSAVAGAVALVL